MRIAVELGLNPDCPGSDRDGVNFPREPAGDAGIPCQVSHARAMRGAGRGGGSSRHSGSGCGGVAMASLYPSVGVTVISLPFCSSVKLH